MDSGAAREIHQPYVNRALEHRAQLRWLYYLSLGSLWFLRHMAFARVFVTPTTIRIDGPGGKVEVLLHRLARVSFFHVPFCGGWITLQMRDGAKHRFSSFLERSDYVLDAIAIAQPTLVPTARLAAYRRSVIAVDHLFARWESALRDWRMLLLMQVALPMTLTVMVGAALHVKDLADAFLIFASIGLLNGLVTVAVWGTLEFFEMLRKHAELQINPLNPLRDLQREKTARIVARTIHLATVSALAWWMWI